MAVGVKVKEAGEEERVRLKSKKSFVGTIPVNSV